MSAAYNPFGLRPSYHPSGVIRPKGGTILSGYASNIFQFSPVAINSADGTLTLAAAAARAIGTFMGVEFTTTAIGGRRVLQNFWPASTVATEIVAYYTDDPWITYAIQANGSIAQALLGNQANWTVNASANGNTTTGMSTVGLDTATLTNSGNAGLRIVGLTNGPDNDWGDAFTIVDVQISQHQNVANQAAY